MKLASFQTPTGRQRIGALAVLGQREVLIDLTRAYALYLASESEPRAEALAEVRVPTDMRLLLEGGEASLDAARRAFAFATGKLKDAATAKAWQHSGHYYDLADIAFLPPVPRPGKIISIGANYKQHLNEFKEGGEGANLAAAVAQLGKASYPPAFAKFPSTLAAHGEPLIYPPWTKQFDYEAELCVVIGTRCKNVKAANALDYVAGYCNINDVSMRDVQADEMKRGVLLLGKNCDTTAPAGPYLVTKDEIPDPGKLRIQCWVNGEPRQDSTTAQMIHGVPAIIEYYSRMTLEPGDMFTTGSPAGVGFTSKDPAKWLLKPGDTVEIEIEGLGRLRNPVVAERRA